MASVASSVTGAVASNFLLTVLMGSAMENLFGMIKQLTLFIVIGMIEVNYPAALGFFYEQVVTLLSFDLL